MPVYEFDGVHFFLTRPGRPPAPTPTLLAYLDSDLSQVALADRLGQVLVDMAAVLAQTVPVPLRPSLATWWVVGQGEGSRRWADGGALDAVGGALRTGRTQQFGILFSTDDEAEFWYLEGWTVPGHDAAVQLSLTPSPDLWPPEDTDRAADRILSLVESWSVMLDLRTAGVTYDRADSHYSPFDKWYGSDHNTTAPQTRERVRGYYWANLLTEGHLKRLNGLDALRNNASRRGLVVRVLDGGAVLLRSPGPVSTFDDDQLAAMKAVLWPVLVPKAYVIYQGYPLRIVPDPDTAFRRVAPGSPFPQLLPGDGPVPGEGPPPG
jgi:hypothetical protein